MRAALHARLRGAASGPLLTFDQELVRFLPWLPPRLRPLLVRLRYWQKRHHQAENVAARLAVERLALADLRRPLAILPPLPLVEELLARIGHARMRSLAERRLALQGKECDARLDDRQLESLLSWLEGPDNVLESELGHFLARLLRAWWTWRHPGIPDLGKH